MSDTTHTHNAGTPTAAGTDVHIRLDSIEDAIAAIQRGEMIIVVDDANRENEGDFLLAARHATPEKINFMAKEGRGLICTPLTLERCRELDLQPMVRDNTDPHGTAFTVSVDFEGDGVTTGISAYDRARTIQALLDPSTRPNQLRRPGHIFPLTARTEGVLRRAGHTEAAIDFARLAGYEPAGVIVEIMNEDGSMARLPELRQIADRHSLMLVSIEDLIEYRLQHESLIKREVVVKMPTAYGEFELFAYSNRYDGQTHLALKKGDWAEDEPVPVRVHSSCVTGDIFASFRCDCGEQLHAAMRTVEQHGKGVVVYLFQEGRGIGLLNKLKAYKLQEEGFDTVEANLQLGFKMDEREYGIGAQILRDVGVRKMLLISNNPRKRAGLLGYGLEIVDTTPLVVSPNPHNHRYIETKWKKMGHGTLPSHSHINLDELLAGNYNNAGDPSSGHSDPPHVHGPGCNH